MAEEPISNIDWQEAIELVKSHVVRISTPQVSGTGFLLTQAKHQDFAAVATAAHVISHAHFWEEPIRLDHHDSNKSVLLRPADRVVFIDESKDTAGILVNKSVLPLPADPLMLAPEGKYLRL